MSPLPPRPARRLAALVPAALLAAAAAGACSDQVTLAPRGSRVLLSLAASGSAAGQQLDIRVTYRRLGGEHVPLGALVTPVDTGARRVPLAIDAAPCFRDPDRDTVGVAARAGAATCPLYMSAALRDAQNALVDSARVGPLSVAFGDTVSIPPILLRRLVRIVPTPGAVELLVNATSSLAVQLLDAHGEPILGRPITWAVADGRIASVSPQGVVRGLVPGRTTVTATREGITAAIPVYVPGVRAMSVTPATATVIATGSQRLALALTPEAGLPNTVTWRSSAPAVATVSDSGVVTAVAPGTATITATSVADTAKKASTAITVTRYQGVARWVYGGNTSATGPVPGTIEHLWAAGANEVYAAAGLVYRWDGARWSPSSGSLGGFRSVHGTSATNAVAVGFNGNAARFDGTAWTALRATTPEHLYDVKMLSPTTAVAVGTTGVVARLDGTAWTVGDVGARDTLFAVWASGPSDVWAGGESGALHHFDGTRWTRGPSMGASERVTSIWGTEPGNVYLTTWHAATGRGRLMRYDGQSWSQVALPGPTGYWGLWAVFGSSRNDVYATADQHLWRFDGTAWRFVDRPYPLDHWGWWMRAGWTDGQTLMVGGGEGGASAISRGGGPWTVLSRTPGWQDAWASDVRNVFAVGHWGAIDRYDGATWRSMASGTENTLLGVWGSSPTNVYASGTQGTLLRYDGTAWAPVAHPGAGRNLLAVGGSGPSNVFVLGDGGYVMRYDGGAWSATTAPTGNQSLNAVWAASATDAFAVGNGGAIVRWDGTAWRAMASGVTVPLYAVWGSGPNNVFVGGGLGTILRFDGTRWQTLQQTGKSMQYWTVGGRAADDVYITGCGGEATPAQRWDGTQLVPMTTTPCVGASVVFAQGGAMGFAGIKQWYRGESPNGTIGLGVPAGAAAARGRRP